MFTGTPVESCLFFASVSMPSFPFVRLTNLYERNLVSAGTQLDRIAMEEKPQNCEWELQNAKTLRQLTISPKILNQRVGEFHESKLATLK